MLASRTSIVTWNALLAMYGVSGGWEPLTATGVANRIKPLDAIPYALDGYGSHHYRQLGDCPRARFLWDKLHGALDDVLDGRSSTLPLADWLRFLDRA